MILCSMKITKQSAHGDMDEIVDSLPSGADHRLVVSGYTPLGTIISYYGETAPRFYLACDGTVYNKADYPELAAHLLSLTDHSAYVVDGDDTKFKVPDLRGEFLRGTGTNSHTDQGNGASVGTHQDATYWDSGYASTNGGGYYTNVDNWHLHERNPDYSYVTTGNHPYIEIYRHSSGQTSGEWAHSSRPTNTSVLWCIAYKDIYMNPMNDYSTNEKVVGSWVDGKPLYQITKEAIGSFSGDVDNFLTLPSNAVVKNFIGSFDRNDGLTLPIPYAYPAASANQDSGLFYFQSSNQINFRFGSAHSVIAIRITVQYTKTTD